MFCRYWYQYLCINICHFADEPYLSKYLADTDWDDIQEADTTIADTDIANTDMAHTNMADNDMANTQRHPVSPRVTKQSPA